MTSSSRKLPAGIEQLPSGTYRATVHTALGGRSRQTFATLDEAQAWQGLEKIRNKRKGSRRIHPNAPGKLSLSAWWADVTQRTAHEGSTNDTYASYWRCHVKPALGPLTLRDLTGPGLDLWVGDLKAKGLADSTISRMLGMLSGVLTIAVKEHMIDANPVMAMNAKPKPTATDIRALSRTEFERILAASTEPYRSLWLLLAFTGLRWAEGAGLLVRNVNLDEAWLKVTQSSSRRHGVKPPKNRKIRTVGLSPDVVKVLTPLVVGRGGSEFVFAQPSGEPLDYHNTRKRAWAPAVATACLSDPQPGIHSLRHSAATWMGESGMSSTELRDVLGHASIVTTEKYTHSNSATLDRMRKAFE